MIRGYFHPPPVVGTTEPRGLLRGKRGPGVLCVRKILKMPFRFGGVFLKIFEGEKSDEAGKIFS